MVYDNEDFYDDNGFDDYEDTVPEMSAAEKQNFLKIVKPGQNIAWTSLEGERKTGRVLLKDGDAALVRLNNGAYRWAVSYNMTEIGFV